MTYTVVKQGQFNLFDKVKLWPLLKTFPVLVLLSCSGGGGDSAPLVAAPINHAPIISGAPELTIAANNVYNFTPTASDPDGDTLSFSIENKPDWASFDTSNGNLMGTPENSDGGAFSDILITVSDGQASASLENFVITVSVPTSFGELPEELDGLNLTLLLEETFDDKADFSNPESRSYCHDNGASGDCTGLPTGWTDYRVGERWHPGETSSSVEAALQVNATQARGGSGKSLIIWDESYGTPSQWGSDALLGKRLEEGHTDIYAEMWIRFQTDYRWHHMDPLNSHGINYAKILRIGHVDPGDNGFSFGGDGTNGPVVILDTVIWARDLNGSRSNRARLSGGLRCEPQETNYRCGDYDGDLTGDLYDTTDFETRFGNSEWHKVALRVKLNSAPGVQDGVGMIWLDNILYKVTDDIPFLGADADPATLLNMITFGGNLHNYPEPEFQQYEQWHSIDDIRIFAIQP